MLDMESDSDEQVIELTDSLNAFRQFREVLFASVRFLILILIIHNCNPITSEFQAS